MNNSRCVRNVWIEGTIDGQKTKFSGGPKSQSGGLQITILQRDKGKISDQSLKIESFVSGNQIITVVFLSGKLIGQMTTER